MALNVVCCKTEKCPESGAKQTLRRSPNRACALSIGAFWSIMILPCVLRLSFHGKEFISRAVSR